MSPTTAARVDALRDLLNVAMAQLVKADSTERLLNIELDCLRAGYAEILLITDSLDRTANTLVFAVSAALLEAIHKAMIEANSTDILVIRGAAQFHFHAIGLKMLANLGA